MTTDSPGTWAVSSKLLLRNCSTDLTHVNLYAIVNVLFV